MANRIVYGLTHSSNGWPMVDQGSCTWVRIPGAEHVTLQIQNGQPLQILRAFAADFHAYVEPLRDADSACWTPTNSVPSSNHLSGTAMDLNWNSHPFQVANAGFNAAQIATIREILAFYEDTVWWGNDWSSPKDAMHFQLGSTTNGGRINTYGNPHTQDFINRKIRPDGFSTFRRGGAPVPVDAAPILARATGLSEARAREILPAVRDGLKQSQCHNVERIAMWLAQIGHESDGFNATQEYDHGRNHGDPNETSDRWRYKGRTWIQITWQSNYAGFSRWCYDRGLVPSPTYFVDRPTELAQLKWAGLGPAWYWTVARPQINSLCDQRNLTEVTRLINGGTSWEGPTWMQHRKERYDRALAQGDALLQLVNEGDDYFLNALSPAEQRELLDLLRWIAAPEYGELRKLFADRSMYRTHNNRTDTIAGKNLHAHAFGWDYRVESSALRGELWAVDLVAQAARGELVGVRKADGSVDQFLVDHARAVLNEIEKVQPQALQQWLAQKGLA